MLSFFVIIFVIQDVHKTYFNISVLEIKIFNKKKYGDWVDYLYSMRHITWFCDGIYHTLHFITQGSGHTEFGP